jgi:hypothetical protein
MTELIRRLSPISADTFLLSILLLLVLFVAVPIGVTFYLKHERKRRRQRNRRSRGEAPQKIGLATDEVVAAPCEHQRSRSRARQTADGAFVSTCKRCGAPMARVGPGDWVISQ